MDLATRIASLREPKVREYWRNAATESTRAWLRGHRGALIAAGVKLHGSGRYELADGARIRRGARINVGEGAVLRLGPGSRIGARANINVLAGLTIGADSDMSWDVEIMDTNFHTVLDEAGRARPVSQPIVIGDHVLVGARAMILKGVTIGDGAIVAAGAVVSRDVPSSVIVAGNPAVEVGRISGWY